MPVPDSGTVCGLFEAPSLIVRLPVRLPVWVGVNFTPITQDALGARLVPLHPSLEMLKSPDAAALFIGTEKLFGLVIVTFLAAEDVPTPC
jgi:hypothetical protein